MLCVRPFLAGRDYHALHHENPHFQFAPRSSGAALAWHPYPGVPGTIALSNGSFQYQPLWYRNFLYTQERARGLDCTEDLAAPGVFRFDLNRGEAVLMFAADSADVGGRLGSKSASECLAELRAAERARRARFGSRLERAADDYVVKRDGGKTIVAGYPWFTDWGRDTFIALRGLCLATGRLDDARDVLMQWAQLVSEGMLPNRFPEHGTRPEFNAVDASLWYVIAVHDYLRARRAAKQRVPAPEQATLARAVDQILNGHAAGTRYEIRMDHDGLLKAGVPGVQLTWMDARVGERVITPRVGKPVEVQALWLNALWIGSRTFALRRWQRWCERGRAAFGTRFWNAAGGYLFDVADVDHRPGVMDASFRPNQIFAVGGLPLALLAGDAARRVLAAVEAKLWTPLGLRTLAAGEPAYVPRYDGGPGERDAGYHQGAVWPWLAGAFVEAWLRVHGHTPARKREAEERFVRPLLQHLDEAGWNHVSELFDAEAPHLPRGCPFQAWSVGELLRMVAMVR
ncbi:MAG: amylo-alpha-1,6-glucosidase [Planctomycetota bacterium]